MFKILMILNVFVLVNSSFSQESKITKYYQVLNTKEMVRVPVGVITELEAQAYIGQSFYFLTRAGVIKSEVKSYSKELLKGIEEDDSDLGETEYTLEFSSLITIPYIAFDSMKKINGINYPRKREIEREELYKILLGVDENYKVPEEEKFDNVPSGGYVSRDNLWKMINISIQRGTYLLKNDKKIEILTSGDSYENYNFQGTFMFNGEEYLIMGYSVMYTGEEVKLYRVTPKGLEIVPNEFKPKWGPRGC